MRGTYSFSFACLLGLNVLTACAVPPTDLSQNAQACDTGQVYYDGACRSACSETQACPAQLTCSSLGVCVTPTPQCANGQLDTDNQETDIDCGGPLCGACANGFVCSQDSDCESLACGTDYLCYADLCNNNQQDSTEADTDCGGSCSPCAVNSQCAVDSDCASSYCAVDTSTCQEPSCSDGVLNGTETHVDCGGGTCTGCANDASCANNSDCASGFCATGTLTCQVAPPDNLIYSAATALYRLNVAISAPNAPTSSGGAIDVYSIEPALPAGLDLNTTSGMISGTPQEASATRVYTITATNLSGSAAALITLTVIDECALGGNSNCSTNASCANTTDGFACTCDPGYSGDGVTCSDINECTHGTHDCSTDATCTNTVGSFTCACKGGFEGDGVTCSDINECTRGTNNCSTDANCTNTAGSFHCACKTGFSGSGVTCSDINECTNGTHDCSTDATCTNTAGSFTCACKTGYSGDGITCSDVDECTAGTSNCSPNATCTNTVGSFTCACKSDYVGNGVTCTGNDTTMAIGSTHACIARSGGTQVQCMGRNYVGCLGDNSTTDRTTPVNVQGLGDDTVKSFALGFGAMAIGIGPYSCAVMGSGGIKCWGRNGNGQLGDGTTTDRYTAVSVQGLTGLTATKVAASWRTTCAVFSSGEAKCWGNNPNGAFGSGNTSSSSVPVSVIKTESEKYTSVVCGDRYCCFLNDSKQVKCSGYGPLGNAGTYNSVSVTTPTIVSTLPPAKAICGDENKVCAVLDSGGVMCWGKNDSSSLGDGTTTARDVPVAVSGVSSGVISCSTSSNTGCAHFDTGEIKCWGKDTPMGTGQFTSPTQVTGMTGIVRMLAQASLQMCAINSSMQTVCMGMPPWRISPTLATSTGGPAVFGY